MRCASCGFESPSGMRFCGQCGAALEPYRGTEERKLVTILFADVVGSTRLSDTLDAEHLRDRIGRFFDIARHEIESHGGTVEKFIGDAVMAVFGLPRIHENDSQRALWAALAIRSRLRPHIDAGTMPEVRIGVNTGEVVADPKAIEKGEFLVTGEVVHLAARLQQQALPGQILVGESTYAAARGTCEFRRVAPFHVKGRQEQVVAYDCVGLRERPPAQRGLAQRIGSPLVGRLDEFTTFVVCLDRLRAGRGGIVGIFGEAGIGKSRLVAEAGRRAAAAGDVAWLEGRTLSFSQSMSYWPFLEIVKKAAGITERDSEGESWTKLESRVGALFPAQVPEIVPYIGTLIGLSAPPEWEARIRYLDGEAMGRQIYRSSWLLFERLAQERPLVVVFEDLHWLDQSSAALLEHLLPLTRSVPILFCGVGRPDPRTPVARLRDIAPREYADRYTEILLAPLPPAESAVLVNNLLESTDFPPRLADAILRKTEGNPFFMEEVIRALIDMEALAQNEATGRWEIRMPIEQITIPDTLRGVIMARVDRLEEAVKQVLKTAAVIGRSFFYRVLRAVLEAGESLDGHLVELRQLELIREKRLLPELEYFFKHALTQEATYESILLRQRRELHRRVGDVIETLFADRLEEFYGVLAYHYARAEDREKAQAYLFKAGDQAGRIAADAEAVAHYREAVSTYTRVFGDTWDPLQRAVLERKMGEALFRQGDHHQALECLERALRHLKRPFPTSSWGVRTAILGQAIRQATLRAAPAAVVEHATREVDPVVEERTRIYAALGWIDYYVDLTRLVLEVLLLLNVSERHHHRLGIAQGSTGVGVICDLIPAYRVAGYYHRRALDLAQRTQHPIAIGLSHIALAIHEFHTGDTWERALEHLRRSATAYRDAGELRQWGAATSLDTWLSRLRGDFAHALALSREIVRVGQEAGDPLVWGWGSAELGRTLLETDGPDGAIGHLQKAAELFQRVPDYLWVVISNSSLGRCYLRKGQFEQALRLLEESNRLAETRGFRGYNLTQPRMPLAEAYLTIADLAVPGSRREWLTKAQRACRMALQQGRVDAEALPTACRFNGTLAWLRGRRAAAMRWWRRAARIAESLGARYELGMCLLEMGKRSGERQQLERAATIFAQIGARWHLARAEHYLDDAQSPPRNPALSH